MTVNELYALIKRCLVKAGVAQEYVEGFWERISPPRAAEYAALYLYLREIPEDEDTKALKSQLRHLYDHGKFQLT